jgi:hypothetical protein
MVKVTANQTPVKQEKPNKGRVFQKSTNKDLPNGCQDGQRWRRRFIPTYMRYIAGSEDPWTIDDDKAQEVLQQIWIGVYGAKLRYTVEINDAVFRIVRCSVNVIASCDIDDYLGCTTDL